MKHTFGLISEVFPESEDPQADDSKKADLIYRFILKLSCDSVNEKYKHMANYESRIFNFDKPNKYKEEVKLMRAIHENISSIPYKKHFSIGVVSLNSDLQ